MAHVFYTAGIPFDNKCVSRVEERLDQLGNPATDAVREKLKYRGIHFMSMSVVPADRGQRPHLVVEASADPGPDGKSFPDRLMACLRDELCDLALAAELITSKDDASAGHLKGLLRQYECVVGQSLFATPGLCFTGTPGMSIDEIRKEYELGRYVRTLIETGSLRGTALQVLTQVRADIAENKPEFQPLLQPHAAPLLAPPMGTSFPVSLILSAVVRFTWPYLLMAIIVSLAISATVYSETGLFWSLIAFAFSVGVSATLLATMVVYFYLLLRKLEATDVPDDSAPEPGRLSEVVRRESKTEQNHLFGISVMKPGLVRNLVLRIVFWVIVQAATVTSRPGFLGELGTIHFARWVLLPGTDKLLFFSNYGGSWESYLEDFITKAHAGLTAAWSNTLGFPRTKNVFQDGATDGDRFKQWARRQQYPTRFWYSAYPYLTTARIRLNSAIRQGLTTAETEDDAAAWLSCLGSRPRTGTVIENYDVQAILFGSFRKLNYGTSLLLQLPPKQDEARAWLSQVEPGISFGDSLPPHVARLIAFTSTGLRKLGCEEQHLDTFPIAFRQGMAAPVRAAILADTGPSKPSEWWWGNEQNGVDATLLIYSDAEDKLEADVAAQIALLEQRGGRCLFRVPFAKYELDQPIREPFGFVDGVSQPIIKGTRRWISDSDKNHVVEPGEFLLGYLDNRGYLPLSPTIPSNADPQRILPSLRPPQSSELPDFPTGSAEVPRDFGRNGSYLVIRQLEQDVELFNQFLRETAVHLEGRQGIPEGFDRSKIEQWLAAKIVGRWKDGTSLVRYPHAPGAGWPDHRKDGGGDGDVKNAVEPDNSFLLGAEDPLGERCPYGSHIRRTNPRDSFTPGSEEQISITNRHRILRMGRSYKPQPDVTKSSKPGLFFMCLNADIERQFEFVQQTWASARLFFGLDGEVDPMLGRGGKGGRLTIPTEQGPLLITGIQRFVTVRGGSYFFLPSRRAIRFLSGMDRVGPTDWHSKPVAPPASPAAPILGAEPEDAAAQKPTGFDLRPSWDSMH